MAVPLARLVSSGVRGLRSVVLSMVGLIVAWTTLSLTIDQFQKNQHTNVEKGVHLIRRIQEKRNAFLDSFFGYMTFLGEEDFYLLSLPWIFWNVEHRLGTLFTLVVCFGIFSGNFLKDMFCIPRPPRDKVWVSPKLHSSDSTGLRDFGFPSTHSVNAFTNPAMLVSYYFASGALSTNDPLILTLAIASGVAYATALAVSRLYLGVHSPSDVRAGIFIGVVLMSIYRVVGDSLYRWLMTDPGIGAVCITVVIVLLVASPQVLPRTPTFHQQCSLLGLVLGDCLGSRWYNDRLGFDRVADFMAPLALHESMATTACEIGLVGVVAAWVARFVLGVVVVLAARLTFKGAINPLLNRLFGVKLFSCIPGAADDPALSDSKIVPLEAFSKTVVYTGLAVGVTYGAPLLHHGLNITNLAPLSVCA